MFQILECIFYFSLLYLNMINTVSITAIVTILSIIIIVELLWLLCHVICITKHKLAGLCVSIKQNTYYLAIKPK